jgi:hypothetical protein
VSSPTHDDKEPARRIQPLDDDSITPEVREAFMKTVARIEKRRKIRLWGYFLALVVMIVGLLASLYYMGLAPHEFRGWAFLVPIAVVGLILWAFGRWSRRA